MVHVGIPSCRRDMEQCELNTGKSETLGNGKGLGEGLGLLFRWDAATPALNKEL